MKKLIIISSLLIAIAIVGLDAKELFSKEKPVDKEINLAISSNNNYSSAAYSDAKASVHVIITKLNGKEQTIVLDKVYTSMQLNEIPTNGKAIESKVIVPNVFNKKEKLIVRYTVSYDSRGSVVQFCSGKVASDKSNQEKIDIHI